VSNTAGHGSGTTGHDAAVTNPAARTREDMSGRYKSPMRFGGQ
jgi:hypothetical protein